MSRHDDRRSGARTARTRAVASLRGTERGAGHDRGRGRGRSLGAHLKVACAFVAWIALLREQARLLGEWPQYYAQALVASAGIAVCALLAVHLYPPRTARWRTLAWTFLASTVVGALAEAGLGGRAGLAGALLAAAVVLWARGEERGRRAVRHLRARRQAG
ncbi:hypothetical protein [Streptomyces sp. GSL17-111]|uniref:hypothetical protein n=1 Tax=Streptomyces sp. GSL17-111 TaxID=3121596 RepID=UPI0030F43E25